MTTATTILERNRNVGGLFRGLLLVAGVALVSVGSYFHLTTAAQVRAGSCDGCEPWHPLLVLAPLLVGATLALLGGYLLYRR